MYQYSIYNVRSNLLSVINEMHVAEVRRSLYISLADVEISIYPLNLCMCKYRWLKVHCVVNRFKGNTLDNFSLTRMQLFLKNSVNVL